MSTHNRNDRLRHAECLAALKALAEKSGWLDGRPHLWRVGRSRGPTLRVLVRAGTIERVETLPYGKTRFRATGRPWPEAAPPPAALPPCPCGGTRYRRTGGAADDGLCGACRKRSRRQAERRPAAFRRHPNGAAFMLPEAVADPARRARVEAYARRAAARLPLFDPPLGAALEDAA